MPAGPLPTVDVIIPMRNGAATIAEAISSALLQTLSPQNIIVVDDGSEDHSATLVPHDPRITLIRTPPRGASSARNTGLRAARAQYVAFLDCDDLWRTDKLERQLQVAVRHPDAAVILCGQRHIRMDGQPVPWRHSHTAFHGHVFEQLLASCFRHGGWCSSMLVRRDVLLESGGFEEGRRFGEDIELCLRLAHRHAFESMPDSLVFIRENPDSTMRRIPRSPLHMEIALQMLSGVDPWLPNRNLPASAFRECARLLLFRLARTPGFSLEDLRERLWLHAPNLASRIARNRAELVLFLGVLSLLQLPRILTACMRHCARSAGRPATSGRLALLPGSESA
jgi:glycosyltransferase involved in cell wall biosynthesis